MKQYAKPVPSYLEVFQRENGTFTVKEDIVYPELKNV